MTKLICFFSQYLCTWLRKLQVVINSLENESWKINLGLNTCLIKLDQVLSFPGKKIVFNTLKPSLMKGTLNALLSIMGKVRRQNSDTIIVVKGSLEVETYYKAVTVEHSISPF